MEAFLPVDDYKVQGTVEFSTKLPNFPFFISLKKTFKIKALDVGITATLK